MKDSKEKLVRFINEIGVDTFVMYLEMIMADKEEFTSMKESYEEELEITGDSNLAIISVIEEDFTYA